ncbi:MAG: hypothetical protein ABF689_14620 [Gluconobacter cerinus]|uniref:GNAT family N-acetyltransferase n=1 Tax=Gluconobacter cerinus TaxID=38307 RepID=UPI0039E847A4
MTDPMEGFITFQPALDAGKITLLPGIVVPNVWVFMDEPNGQKRWTYVRLENNIATCMAVLTPAEPYEGKHVFQLGYAVLEHFRGQGKAKDISRAAITELTTGFAKNGLNSLYIEIVVGRDNPASIAVAQSLVKVKPKEISDKISGLPALQFMQIIETKF